MTLAALGTFITTVLLILIQYRLDTLNPRAKKDISHSSYHRPSRRIRRINSHCYNLAQAR